jgi:chromosome segregation ATPase/CheY-like chemotaxis protein
MALFAGKRRASKRSGKTGGGPGDATVDETTGAPPAPGGAPAEPHAARTEGRGTQDALAQLEALSASGARFTSFATDALRVILDALHLHRGALLVFDPFDQTLALVASRGLDPQGQERLRRVRRNDPLSWDMPLHGLLSERAYLIDEPSLNRYVPPLAEQGNAALARIACLPLFRQRHPVGALVVLVGRNERFGEAEIRAAGVWLRYLATIIDDLRDREGMAALGGRNRDGALAADKAGAPAPTDGARGYDGRRRADDGALEVGPFPPGSAAQAAGDAALRARLAELEAEGRALRAEMETARRAHTAMEQDARARAERLEEFAAANARLGAERTAAMEELRTTRARLDTLERTLESGSGEIAGLVAERDAARVAAQASEQENGTLQVALERLQRETRGLETELDAARERRKDDEETIAELRAAVARLEGERRTLAADLEAARARGSTRDDAATELRAQLGDVRAEATAAAQRVAELEAAVQSFETERGIWTARVDAARARETESRQAATEFGRTVQRLEAERTIVSERCESLSQQIRRLEQMAAERARSAEELRRELEAATSAGRPPGDPGSPAYDEIVRGREEWQRRAAELEAQVARLEAEHARTRERLAATEWQEAEARRMAGESGAHAQALEARVRELEQAGTAALTEAASARALAAAVQKERERWREEAAASGERLAAAEERAQTAEGQARRLEGRTAALSEETTRARADAEAAGAKARALEERVRDTTAAAAGASEEAAAAVRDRTRWRGEAEQAAKRVVELTRAAEAMRAEAARNAARAQDAAAETERLRDETGRLRERIAVLEDAARGQSGTEEALRRRVGTLEAELMTHVRAATELQETVVRLEAEGDAARAEAGLARAEATRAATEAAAAAEQVAALTVERDAQVEQVVELTTTLARLRSEGAPTAAEPPPQEQGGGEPPAPAAVAEEMPLLVVEPNAATARALLAGLGGDAEIVAPKDGAAAVAQAVASARPAIIAVNLGARGPLGGFHVLQALNRVPGAQEGLRLCAYVAPPQATKGVALGIVEWMTPPESADGLVELFGRLGTRGARALSVGLDMQLLVGARKHITQRGVSLSMACDSKQAQELRDMVNPQILLVDLELPRGDGYRAIGRLAGDAKEPATWVLCGGASPPAEAGSLVVSGAMERSSASFLNLADLGRALRKATGVRSADDDETTKGTRDRTRERATARGRRVGAASR